MLRIRSGRHEVPEEQIVQLRTQLLEQIAAFSTGPKVVLTRLCVAVSRF